MKRLPKSKKKRIQNKYIPKGIYCYSDLNTSCPYWFYRKATEKDLIKIYTIEKEYLKKENIKSFEEFKKYLKENLNKDTEYFTDVYECKLIHYTEYCQDGLLWDQCKECYRNEGDFEKSYHYHPITIPNRIRIKSKKERLKWLEEMSLL